MTQMDRIEALIMQGFKDKQVLMQLSGLTEKQVIKAVQNLSYTGRISLVKARSAGRHKGRQLSEYEVTGIRVSKKRKSESKEDIAKVAMQTQPNSVFALG
jgi:hypothetical protein